METPIHNVRPGEWLDRIARDHDTTRDALIELNPWLSDREDFLLFPNDKINLPTPPEAPRAEGAPGPMPPPPRTRPQIRPPRLTRDDTASRPEPDAEPDASSGDAPVRSLRPQPRPGSIPPAGAPDVPPPGTPLEGALRREDEGPMVHLLQTGLVMAGFNTDRDGVYGPDTERRVRAAQRAYGLTVDGIAGQNTWTMLFRNGPSALRLNGPGEEYVRDLRLDPEVANSDAFDHLAQAEAAHAQELLRDAGFSEIAPSITPEVLKAMWFRESHFDPAANEGNGRGLGQITQTGFHGMFQGDFMPRGVSSPRGWLDLARVHSGQWPESRDAAWRHFRDNFDDPELNASLSTVWLVAQLMRNAQTDEPLREALVDYNGSNLRHTYARQVLRLRNAFLEPIRGPEPTS